jgi:hypothetical protein
MDGRRERHSLLIVLTLRRSLFLVHGSIVPNALPSTPGGGPETVAGAGEGAVNDVVSWIDPAMPAAAPGEIDKEAG